MWIVYEVFIIECKMLFKDVFNCIFNKWIKLEVYSGVDVYICCLFLILVGVRDLNWEFGSW